MLRILRLADVAKAGLYEKDIVKARAPVTKSETLGIPVPGIDLPPGDKCVHGIYLPHGEPVALYCSICNPYVLEASEGLLRALGSQDSAQEQLQEEQLQEQVEDGGLSEHEALNRLASRRDPEPKVIYDINAAHAGYVAGTVSEGLFYQSLLKFVEKTVKRQGADRGTYSNTEDAISNSALDIWQRLSRFDGARSSFAHFATIVTLSQMRILMRKYKSDRGGQEHIQLEEDSPIRAPGLDAQQRLLFDEWLKNLESTDRDIVQMLQDGLSQLEIGEALGISQQAVSKRLERLRTQTTSPFLTT